MAAAAALVVSPGGRASSCGDRLRLCSGPKSNLLNDAYAPRVNQITAARTLCTTTRHCAALRIVFPLLRPSAALVLLLDLTLLYFLRRTFCPVLTHCYSLNQIGHMCISSEKKIESLASYSFRASAPRTCRARTQP